MDEEKIIEEIKKFTKDNAITCAEALVIVKKLKVSPKTVGDIINRLKIKVKKCSLGLFD